MQGGPCPPTCCAIHAPPFHRSLHTVPGNSLRTHPSNHVSRSETPCVELGRQTAHGAVAGNPFLQRDESLEPLGSRLCESLDIHPPLRTKQGRRQCHDNHLELIIYTYLGSPEDRSHWQSACRSSTPDPSPALRFLLVSRSKDWPPLTRITHMQSLDQYLEPTCDRPAHGPPPTILKSALTFPVEQGW